MKSCRLSITIIILLLSANADAQQYDTVSIFSSPVELDSFVVKSNFDVNAFIRRVRQDTTFYKAFKSMHLIPNVATAKFISYNKHNNEEASLIYNTQQIVDKKKCRRTIVVSKDEKGRFLNEKGQPVYYTAELFFSLFYASKPICNQTDIVAGSIQQLGKSRMEKNKYELKQLIFNPGAKIKGIPLMGDKASIFDKDEIGKYNLKITQEKLNEEDCFVFRITPKTDFKNKVVYNELITWFRKRDYSILARNYSLSYHTLFYDFDVEMKVSTRQIGDRLYPTFIDYDGTWHVATQGKEKMKVVMQISYQH